MGFDTTTSIATRRAMRNAPPPEMVVVQDSPLRNGTMEMRRAALVASLTPDEHGMAFVESTSNAVDEDGNPLRTMKHRIRAACLHWAPNHAINDCRRGCGAKEK